MKHRDKAFIEWHEEYPLEYKQQVSECINNTFHIIVRLLQSNI